MTKTRVRRPAAAKDGTACLLYATEVLLAQVQRHNDSLAKLEESLAEYPDNQYLHDHRERHLRCLADLNDAIEVLDTPAARLAASDLRRGRV